MTCRCSAMRKKPLSLWSAVRRYYFWVLSVVVVGIERLARQKDTLPPLAVDILLLVVACSEEAADMHLAGKVIDGIEESVESIHLGHIRAEALQHVAGQHIAEIEGTGLTLLAAIGRTSDRVLEWRYD